MVFLDEQSLSCNGGLGAIHVFLGSPQTHSVLPSEIDHLTLQINGLGEKCQQETYSSRLICHAACHKHGHNWNMSAWDWNGLDSNFTFSTSQLDWESLSCSDQDFASMSYREDDGFRLWGHPRFSVDVSHDVLVFCSHKAIALDLPCTFGWFQPVWSYEQTILPLDCCKLNCISWLPEPKLGLLNS